MTRDEAYAAREMLIDARLDHGVYAPKNAWGGVSVGDTMPGATDGYVVIVSINRYGRRITDFAAVAPLIERLENALKA